MIVCSCRRVSDRAVHDAIHAGACDVADIRAASGAAARCRGCVPALLDLLAQHGIDPPAALDDVA